MFKQNQFIQSGERIVRSVQLEPIGRLHPPQQGHLLERCGVRQLVEDGSDVRWRHRQHRHGRGRLRARHPLPGVRLWCLWGLLAMFNYFKISIVFHFPHLNFRKYWKLYINTIQHKNKVKKYFEFAKHLL